MEYSTAAIVALSLLAGLAAGFLVARARYTGALEASRSSLEELRAREEALAAQVAQARDQLERERIEQAKNRVRLEEAQASLEQQRRLIEEASARLADTFKALSLDALHASGSAFMQMAQKAIEAVASDMKGDLEKRQAAVEAVVRPLEESLKRYEAQVQAMEQSRQAAFGDISRHIGELVRMQERLADQTRSLATALKEPKARGRWGELTLRRVVELAGMSAHCDFTEQVSTGTEDGRRRPDLVVTLPGNRRIVVDAKAPLDAFLAAYEAADPDSQNALLARHARSVKDHVQALSSREYWKQFTPTPDFVVLFLPGEQFFAAALEKDSSLIDDAIAKKVLIATPVTLIALLRSVAMSWQEHGMQENARRVWETGRELFDRLRVFVGHLERMRTGIESAAKAYNDAVGSFESRVVPSANRLKSLTAPGVDDAACRLEPVGVSLRRPPEALPDEADD
ncbi:MAG TPA: DNA recombination protein RmuC [Deltaproteobacteria bacterium]|nr:DNA recombination protein RmuC [Deltaproteobacteria bacterium]